MPEPVAPAAPAGQNVPTPQPATTGAGGSAPKPGTATPPGTGSPGVPVPVQTFARKLKINGKEVEAKATEDELWDSHRQVASVGEARRTLAAERKEMQTQLAEWKARQEAAAEDPLLFLREKLKAEGRELDETDYYTRQLHERLSREPKDPREAELLARERQIYEREALIRADEENRQAAIEGHKEKVELNRVGTLLLKALAPSGLPKDDAILDMAAKLYFDARDAEIELSEEEILKGTMETVTSHQKALFDKLTGDQILDTFPDASRKIHEALVARYKAKQAAPPPAPVQPAQSAGQAPPTGRTELEAHRELEKAAGRRILRTI